MQLYLLALLTIILLIVIAILYFMYRKVNHLSILVNQLLNDMVSLQNITESQMRQSVMFPPALFQNMTMTGGVGANGEHICLTADGDDNISVNANEQNEEHGDDDGDDDSDSSSSSSDSSSNSIDNEVVAESNEEEKKNEQLLYQVDEIMENEIKKKVVETVPVQIVEEPTPVAANVVTPVEVTIPLTNEKIITMGGNMANEEEKKKKAPRKKKEFNVDIDVDTATATATEPVPEPTPATEESTVAENGENIVVSDEKKPAERKKYQKKTKIISM